jgi:hypothetical protein
LLEDRSDRGGRGDGQYDGALTHLDAHLDRRAALPLCGDEPLELLGDVGEPLELDTPTRATRSRCADAAPLSEHAIVTDSAASGTLRVSGFNPG